MTTAKSVNVELAGIRLSVRTDASKERVQSIVKDIEARLREINEQAQSAPLNRRLILAALMLGEDLMQARTEAEGAHEKTSALQQELEQSSAELDAKAGELGLLQQKVDALAKSKAALEASAAERDEESKTLREQLTAAIQRAEQAERQASESAAALDESQRQLEQAHQERSELSQTKASSSARQQELEEKLRANEEMVSQLQSRSSEVADKAQTALGLVEDSELIASS